MPSIAPALINAGKGVDRMSFEGCKGPATGNSSLASSAPISGFFRHGRSRVPG